MGNRYLDIKNVLDIPAWEELQDDLARHFGAAIMCVDLRGVPVTKYSGCSEFCSAVRKDAQMDERCQRCAALAGLEAARLDVPCVCKCHCGLVEAAVPVVAEDTYLGSVLVGQIRLPEGDSEKVVRLVNEISPVLQNSSEASSGLHEAFSNLPEMDYGRMTELVGYVEALVKYAVKRALHAEEAAFFGTAPVSADNTQPSLPVDSSIPKSSPLYPAVLYVHEHLRESITMKDMANLCHLSSSYFSRLFSREAGESFVSYVNRNKVELAKTMLRDSNRSISQISSDIGFHDTSHFISLFKRFEGTTPTVYRQFNCR